MEIKEWSQYTEEEKKKLLKHWWYYYGKMIITLEEQVRFEELVNRDSDKVFCLANTYFMVGESSQTLIKAMRIKREEELLSKLPNMNNEDGTIKDVYHQAQLIFLSMIVESYNNPKPDIPMTREEMAAQISEIERHK